MKKLKSFTMIELLVVIAVILILTAFSIYSLGPARARARDSRRISDANLIMSAVGQYYTSHLRTYPVGLGTTPDPTDSRYYSVVIDGSSFLSSSDVTEYLSPIPNDPINSGQYRYVYVYRGDGKKAAIVVDKLESMVDRCNIDPTSTSLPEPVNAYVNGEELTGGGPGPQADACYFVTQ